MTEHVIIDGDLLAYRSAAANEKRSIVATHIATGKIREFDTRTELKKSLIAKGKRYNPLDFVIEDIQTPSEASYAKYAVKNTINKICKACGTQNYHVVMSGDTNFRLDLPLPSRYKSNREDTQRPLQLAEIRQYILQQLGAELSVGEEADDVLCQYAYTGYKEKRKIVQATIDKDADSNSGWLFNWNTMLEPVYISGLGELHETGSKVAGTGRKWFYQQCLIGDAADGYKPTELCDIKYGERSSFKLLNPLSTDKECWQVICDMYKEWYPEPITYKAWDGVEHTKDYLKILQMYVDCAHMRRWKDDRLIVTDILNKLGVNYEH